jgi:hypothetical protein
MVTHFHFGEGKAWYWRYEDEDECYEEELSLETLEEIRQQAEEAIEHLKNYNPTNEADK